MSRSGVPRWPESLWGSSWYQEDKTWEGRDDHFLSLIMSYTAIKGRVWSRYPLFLADKEAEAERARLFAQSHTASR